MDSKTFEYMKQRVDEYEKKQNKIKQLNEFRDAFKCNDNCYASARIGNNSESLYPHLEVADIKQINGLIADYLADVIQTLEIEMGEI